MPLDATAKAQSLAAREYHDASDALARDEKRRARAKVPRLALFEATRPPLRGGRPAGAPPSLASGSVFVFRAAVAVGTP
jgi:hypothetical protein